ncbi:hydrolase 1, exosortase A system-associated [Iodidimonas sp. SYSU 1G8]|uniref:hydrolase 1, exosortase A system-associated n=1 Tax=Iodidimonas sp. SYSU 1G8 TaxID=3133967 RepID=UPI0031FF171F
MAQSEERSLVFMADGTLLVGVLHLPEEDTARAVLIVPGAPQTRVGPHRLFVDLARQLTAHGVAVMRMDRRGFGDSSGPQVEFENAGADIAAAVAALRNAQPGIRSVCVMGLCDGASAALLHATVIPGVDELILINPWARTDGGEARAVLQAYYLPRLLRWRRWLAVMTSYARMRGALGSLATAVVDAVRTSAKPGGQPEFIAAMLGNWVSFKGRSLVILSDRDLTATAFDDVVRQTLSWPVLMRSTRAEVAHIRDADHTFSSRKQKALLAGCITAWLETESGS